MGRVPGLRRLCVVAPLALLAGCGTAAPAVTGTPREATPEPRAQPARPAICGPLHMTRTGTVATAQATELSGLVASPDQRGVLWTHNDSGDRPRVFALRADGSVLADLDVPGAEAVDWEDIAIGPEPSGGRALYVADIGDNAARRAAVDVYRFPEPRVPATGTTAPATRLRLRYPDGPHDAETLLVDPRTGELAIVTKALSGASGVYVTRRARPGAVVTLRRAATLELDAGGLATGGDVSADGRVVAVRTYTGLVAWVRRPGASLAATLRRTPCRGRVALGGEGQGEALALSRHGRSLVTVPEGAGAAIRRYAVARR
jgi:hypothetical protein